MQVADLFITLGVKNADKTVSALVSVEGGIKNIASASWEAKAAILGAMYALEQYMSKSMATGTALSNFSALTGMSTKTLQQYQYAAQQVGVSNDEMLQTFGALQQGMTKQTTGQGAIGGWGPVANALQHMGVGGFTAKDAQEYAKSPEKLLQKLQIYAQNEKNLGQRNMFLKTFGISDTMIAALSKGAFNEKALGGAPAYSDKAIQSLSRADAMWRNLNQSIQMAVGGFAAAHGGQIAGFFEKMIHVGLKFAEIILKISERFHLWEAVDKTLDLIVTGADSAFASITKLIDAVSAFATKNKIFDSVKDTFKDIGHQLNEFGEKAHIFENFQKFWNNIVPIMKIVVDYFTKFGQEFVKVIKESNALEHVVHIFFDIIDVVEKLISVMGRIGDKIFKAGDSFKAFQIIAQTLDVFLSGIEHTIEGIGWVLDKVNNFMSHTPSKQETATAVGMNPLGNVAGSIGILAHKLFGGGEDKAAVANAPKEISDTLAKMEAAKLEPIKEKEDKKKEEKEKETKPEKPEVAALKSELPENLKMEDLTADNIVKMLSSATKKGADGVTIFEARGLVIAPNLKLIVPPGTNILGTAEAWKPRSSYTPPQSSSSSTQNYNVNQNLNFSGSGSNSSEAADIHKRALNHALRTSPAVSQGT